MSEDKNLQEVDRLVDPLIVQLRRELNNAIDIKRLSASNIFGAIVIGMQIVSKLNTKTNAQKKTILLDSLNYMVSESSLSQTNKDDLTWVINEMGPTIVEEVLLVAKKGSSLFKQSKCFRCLSA